MAAKTSKRKTQTQTQRAKTTRKRAAPKKQAGTKKRASTTAATVKLDPQLRIGQAADLKHRLNKLLDEKTRIRIDASRVEKVDTSTLQLLTAFFIKARDRSIDITWLKPAEPLFNAAQLLGLNTALQLSGQKASTDQRRNR